MQALRYYARAAELAIGHFAPMEAINITANALKLLQRCPDGPLRMEAELMLRGILEALQARHEAARATSWAESSGGLRYFAQSARCR